MSALSTSSSKREARAEAEIVMIGRISANADIVATVMIVTTATLEGTLEEMLEEMGGTVTMETTGMIHTPPRR